MKRVLPFFVVAFLLGGCSSSPTIPAGDCLLYDETAGVCVEYRAKDKAEFEFKIKNESDFPVEIAEIRLENWEVPLWLEGAVSRFNEWGVFSPIPKDKNGNVPVEVISWPKKLPPRGEGKVKVLFKKKFLERVACLISLSHPPDGKICYFFTPTARLKDGTKVELNERKVCFKEFDKPKKVIKLK